MSREIRLLDCTLRDGGMGLESRSSAGIPVKAFTEDEKIRIAELIRDSGADIVEIGSISSHFPKKEHFTYYEDIRRLAQFVPKKTKQGQLFAAFYVEPDTPPQNIPDYSEELVECVRMGIRYSTLQESLDHCAALAKKGYKVFIQPTLTMRYTDRELDQMVDAANDMGAYALYFVDSFGYMEPKDVERLYCHYARRLDPAIRIGFHPHNNMDSAFQNVRYFIETLADRDRIVDACVAGMGQGAGNMQTELLMYYLNRTMGTSYRIEKVLSVCDLLDKFQPNSLEGWGYSPLQFISVMHKAAYKYAVSMKTTYGMALPEIHQALSLLQGDMRHRYTPEDLERLLKWFRECKESGHKDERRR